MNGESDCSNAKVTEKSDSPVLSFVGVFSVSVRLEKGAFSDNVSAHVLYCSIKITLFLKLLCVLNLFSSLLVILSLLLFAINLQTWRACHEILTGRSQVISILWATGNQNVTSQVTNILVICGTCYSCVCVCAAVRAYVCMRRRAMPWYLRGGPLLEMGGDRQTSRWCQSNQNPFKCEKCQNTHKQPCAGRAAERLSDCLPEL